MPTMRYLGAALALLLARTPSSSASAPADSLRVDTLRYGRFGQVVVYRQHEHPSQVVLFVSGDGGWNRGVVRMAERLADLDALVVGIDLRRYLHAPAAARERCSDPAADFEALSQWIQQRLGFPSYVRPVLAGYSSGGSLVYAILAQAPPGTFQGGLSLGFCPYVAAHRRFCAGSGQVSTVASRGRDLRLNPVAALAAPWIVLQGEIDRGCPAEQAPIFVRRIRNARIVLIPGVGHGFSDEARWMPQFREAFTRLTRETQARNLATASDVRDLPLVELESPGSSRELAVVVSGDGGWASIDRQIGETFAADGVPVVGINSLRYFWRARTPNQASADLTRILRHYLQAWHASRVLLVGYSFGADVLPFLVSRLPADVRDRIDIVALLAPSRRAEFEFHFADLLGMRKSAGLPVAPEVQRLRGLRLLCVHGTDETDSACRDLPRGLAEVVTVPGGHHFAGAYREVARRILESARTPQMHTSP